MLWFTTLRTDVSVTLSEHIKKEHAIDSGAGKKPSSSLLSNTGRSCHGGTMAKSNNLLSLANVFLFFHTKHKVINVRESRESRNQSCPPFVLETFLCCTFSYRVWGKYDTRVAVTLQWLLKAGRAQWFLGTTVEGGHPI